MYSVWSIPDKSKENGNVVDEKDCLTENRYTPVFQTPFKNKTAETPKKTSTLAETILQHNAIYRFLFDFTQKTTFHGVRYIFEDKSGTNRRLLWLLVVFLGIGLFIFQVSSRSMYYFSYPVTVKVKVTFNESLMFPSVALCNMNAFSLTKAYKQNYSTFIQTMYTQSTDEDKFAVIKEYDMGNYTKADLSLMLGHTMEDMLVRCEWKMKECDANDFVSVITDHGLCYVFNYKNDSDHATLADPGSDHGLQLTINIQQYEYMAGPHDSAGLKMLLFDRHTIPLVRELGQAISTGSHTFVGVKIVKVSNLPPEHGECVKHLKLDYFPVYTQLNCETECRTKYLYKSCGCRIMGMPQKDGRPPVCNLERHFRCAKNIIEKFDQLENHECKCPIPCETIGYEPSFSYATSSGAQVDYLNEYIVKKNVSKAFIRARDILYGMNNYHLEDDKYLITNVSHYTDKVTTLLTKTLPDKIKGGLAIIGQIKSNLLSFWNQRLDILKYQEFIVVRNYYRGVLAHYEHSYSEVSNGYLPFMYRIRRDISSMQTLPDNSSRRAIYDMVKNEIYARQEVADVAIHEMHQDIAAYLDAKPICNITFGNNSLKENNIVTPKGLLKLAMNHTTDVINSISDVFLNLKMYNNSLNGLTDVLDSVFYHNKTNSTQLGIFEECYPKSVEAFLNSYYQLKYDAFSYPQTVMNTRVDNLNRLLRGFDDTYEKIYSTIKSISENLAEVTNSWKIVTEGLQVWLDYYNDTSIGKTKPSEYISTKYFRRNLTKISGFFGNDVRGLQNRINDKWADLLRNEVKIFGEAANCSDSHDYYIYIGESRVSQGYAKTKQLMEKYYFNADNEDKINLDMVIGTRDADLTYWWDELLDDADEYLERNEINHDFYRANFLTLDIFYRELCFEKLEQQEAYSLFGLFCDIGGSMGLFVGASLMTLFELIDAIVLKVTASLKKKSSVADVLKCDNAGMKVKQ